MQTIKGPKLTLVRCYFQNRTTLWNFYLGYFLEKFNLINIWFSPSIPLVIKTVNDGSSTFKSCDPNISQAFSDLLRKANANHAQKQKEMIQTQSSSKDEEAAGSSKDDSVSEERDDIHFDPIVQLPEQVSNKLWFQYASKLLVICRLLFVFFLKSRGQ